MPARPPLHVARGGLTGEQQRSAWKRHGEFEHRSRCCHRAGPVPDRGPRSRRAVVPVAGGPTRNALRLCHLHGRHGAALSVQCPRATRCLDPCVRLECGEHLYMDARLPRYLLDTGRRGPRRHCGQHRRDFGRTAHRTVTLAAPHGIRSPDPVCCSVTREVATDGPCREPSNALA